MILLPYFEHPNLPELLPKPDGPKTNRTIWNHLAFMETQAFREQGKGPFIGDNPAQPKGINSESG